MVRRIRAKRAAALGAELSESEQELALAVVGPAGPDVWLLSRRRSERWREVLLFFVDGLIPEV